MRRLGDQVGVLKRSREQRHRAIPAGFQPCPAVIIKRGENGSLLFTPDRVFLAPAHPLETVRDPTGAGDAFAGGLMGAIARSGDGQDVLRRGMLYGSVLGSLAVEDFSVRRIMQADQGEVEARLSTLVDMISLDGARAT